MSKDKEFDKLLGALGCIMILLIAGTCAAIQMLKHFGSAV